jgi:hypothetical protein
MELISWLEAVLFALLFFFVWDLFNSDNIRGKRIQTLLNKVQELERELQRINSRLKLVEEGKE